MMTTRNQPARGLPLAFHLWDWLTEPAASVKDFEARLKSRWMAALFVVLMPFGLLVAAVPPLVDGRPPWDDPQVQGVFGLAVFFSVTCYSLSRRGRYKASAFIAVCAATITIYSISPIDNDAGNLVNDTTYLIATLMFSSIMLSQRTTAALLVINVIALLLQPLISPVVNLEGILKGPLSLLVITFALAAFGAYLRSTLENYHLTALQTEITERRRAEEHLAVSLQEKEMLLQEIHHRVKNNLQIIASLLNLQSASIGDPVTLAHFQDSQNRIRTMALIHEHLYRSDDLARIDFGRYLRDLNTSLVQAYRGQTQGVTLQVDADPVRMDIDTAIPCGLLTNELVSNALKHAFPDGRSGQVHVEIRKDGTAGPFRLAVEDDGVGIPPGVDLQNTPSLGLQLVHSLVKQLNGTITIHPLPGTRITVCFPDPSEHNEV